MSTNTPPMDKIHIRDLLLRCIIGIYPHERREKQDVIVNVTAESDFAAAAATDRIEDAVNYKTVTKNIVRFVEGSDYQLIETLAERIAEICLKERKIRRVTVTVDKPGALRFA